jgi:hypothetical protein
MCIRDSGYPHLGALDAAIDGSEKAYQWLANHKQNLLVIFADACREKEYARRWLRENQLDIFIRLAIKIHTLRNNQVWDYHKIHF